MGNAMLYLVLGLAAGILGGLFGIGGGIIIIPAFIYIFGMSQHMAQGTTLALMVPPIGLLAAWTYYNHGDVNLKVAAFVCLGFFIGGLLGAKVAVGIPDTLLRKMFGVFLLAIAVHMIFTK
jgi:uncharacterized protein